MNTASGCNSTDLERFIRPCEYGSNQGPTCEAHRRIQLTFALQSAEEKRPEKLMELKRNMAGGSNDTELEIGIRACS